MIRIISGFALFLLCVSPAQAKDKHELDVRAIDTSLTREKDGKLEFDIKKQIFEADSDFGKFKAPLSDVTGMELERRGERSYLRVRLRLKGSESEYFFVIKEDNRDKLTRRLTELQQDTKVAIKGL